METSIDSSPSIGREEVFNPTYESNVHFDWGLEGYAMEMKVDKEEGAMDVVVSEPRSQQEITHHSCIFRLVLSRHCHILKLEITPQFQTLEFEN
ncbi:hypothetical protein RHMOL_Rhmol02G0216500 [Rhododendron molle]|uniref:Uncharacterized protein n=2 Tax=Rhododendron molle TaxID=49168 RepID=A0ACC0PT30_RHOML|nr:hypothetical protein RHMOL_Rhmol04G0374000 [Rhododendron molle]KAI8568645.1 hypothetical protein RHMOL_Rhmol02G0216500 [Rhododendron molle]